MNPARSSALLPSAAKAVGRDPSTGGQVMLVECAPQGGPLQSAAAGGAPGRGGGLTCRWPRLRPRNREGGLFSKGPPIPPTPHQPRILYFLSLSKEGRPERPGAAPGPPRRGGGGRAGFGPQGPRGPARRQGSTAIRPGLSLFFYIETRTDVRF